MSAPSRPSATVVWSDALGTGRHVFVRFRRRFQLATVPAQAELNLFGDTRYRLRVNGAVACYGPARFAPAHPEADTVDLTPWLRAGDNELLVEVNHQGAPSFAHAASSGGFVAWGRAGEHDLATPGAWECRRETAWDGEAMAISFAQGPLECCDTRLLDGDGWRAPVARDRQDAWGAFRPRSIPHLDLRCQTPERRLGAYRLAREWRFGCRIAGPGSGGGVRRRAAYACCIHSPQAQEVPIALFWGPHFLNGAELACRNHPQLGNRQEAVLALRAGWNLLYGEPEVMLDGWGLLFSLPEDRGLAVSATPDLRDPCILRHTASAPEAELAARRGAVPAAAEALPDLGWTLVRRDIPAPGPSHHPGWDAPATALPLPEDQVQDLELPAGDHAVVWDLGHEYLGHIQVSLEAPAGTVVDIISCERRRDDGLVAPFGFLWLFNEADRLIAHGGAQEWEGFCARGGRYVQVTVRGATAPVRLRRVAVRETVYPFAITGAFACSDPFLDWAFRAGTATLRACSEDTFIDCPSRERGLYTFDAVVEHHVARVLSTDTRLFRRCLWLYAMNQRPDGHLQDVTPAHKPVTLGDFSFWWVVGLDDYHRRTLDRSLVDEVWPHLLRLIASPTHIPDGDGLLDAGRIASEHPTVVVLDRQPGLLGNYNVLWCAALAGAARLAEATGKAEAAALRTRADAARAALRRRLWIPAEGCFAGFVDGGQGQGNRFRTTMYAISLGVADAAQERAGMDYLARSLATAIAAGGKPLLGPNDGHFLLLACRRTGRPDVAEAFLRHSLGSNHRAGAWTLWEHTTPNTSLCHAWSAGVVWWLSDQVLGASWDPARPGLVTIAPDSHALTWAAGTVPHPAGPLSIRWEIRGQELHVAIQAPAGVETAIRPTGRLAGFRLRVS